MQQRVASNFERERRGTQRDKEAQKKKHAGRTPTTTTTTKHAITGSAQSPRRPARRLKHPTSRVQPPVKQLQEQHHREQNK